MWWRAFYVQIVDEYHLSQINKLWKDLSIGKGVLFDNYIDMLYSISTCVYKQL